MTYIIISQTEKQKKTLPKAESIFCSKILLTDEVYSY